MIKIIVAYNRKRVIGRSGKIPWKCQQDIMMFKAITYGSPIIMGRGTWDSLERKPLNGRKNIVISSTLNAGEGYELFRSLEESLENYPNAWIIGGQKIYEQALKTKKVEKILITIVNNEEDGDAFFPDIDGYSGCLYFKQPECEFWSFSKY